MKLGSIRQVKMESETRFGLRKEKKKIGNTQHAKGEQKPISTAGAAASAAAAAKTNKKIGNTQHAKGEQRPISMAGAAAAAAAALQLQLQLQL